MTYSPGCRRPECSSTTRREPCSSTLPSPETCRPPHPVHLFECSLAGLGLAHGGTLPQLRQAVLAAGLTPCPPAVAPLLRLCTLDQVNSTDSVLRHGRVPDGSVHVLSPSLGEDPSVHRGFHLRVVEGVPWLRGFMCDDLHMFGADDRWIVCSTPRTTDLVTKPRALQIDRPPARGVDSNP